MAARHVGRRIGTVSSQHRAAERRRRSTPAAPHRVQRGKRETLTPGERRHLIQLVACGSIFVLLVAVKLLLPGRMAQVNAKLTGMLEQNIDVQAVFSAVGRAVSGEADVDVALQDMYQAVFDPQEDSAVEVSAPAGGEAVSLQLPAAIAPLRAFRTGTGSSDGWLDLPAAASQTAETAQTADSGLFFGGGRRFPKTHTPLGRRIEFGIDSDRGGSVMAARHVGRRIGTVSSQHRAAERRRRSTPAAPHRVQRGKRETLTPGERRHLIQLVACGSIFVLLVAVKLLLPGRMAQVNAKLTGMLEQNIDVQAVFSAVGRAVSGEADVDVALQDMYQAVFDPQEDSAVEVSAPAGGEAVSLQLPAAIAPLRAFRTGTGSSDGWLDLPAAASQTAETAQTAEADQTAETAETASQGAAEASTLAYVLYSDQNLPDNVCLEQALLGFDYCTPVMGTLTSDFGYREHPVEGEERFHYGIDIGAAAGTEIGCFADGTVTAVGESSSYGKYITVAHEGGYSTLYAHCSRIIASSGASVKEGDVIAEVGETGVATGPHLHFELHEGSQYLNPIYYVSLA